MLGFKRRAERTIADNERQVRRPWTSSDLGISGSQTVGPYPYLWAQHCVPARGFLSDERRSAPYEEVVLRDLTLEIHGLKSHYPAVTQTSLDARGST